MKKTKHESLSKKYENPIEIRRKTEIDYTLHPPEGEFTQEEIRNTTAYISRRIAMLIEDVVPIETMTFLGTHKRGFDRATRRKPIYLIETFLMAHEAGIYPPMWVLNNLAERFGKWYAQEGRTSLDMFFGVDTYKGETPIFKDDKILYRNEFLCLRVYLLSSEFEFSIKTACKIVAATHGEFSLSARSLEAIYIKGKYADIFSENTLSSTDYMGNNEEPIKGVLQYIPRWGVREKRSFLGQFSKDSKLLNKRKKNIEDLIYDTHKR